jgi:hypothetical protein
MIFTLRYLSQIRFQKHVFASYWQNLFRLNDPKTNRITSFVCIGAVFLHLFMKYRPIFFALSTTAAMISPSLAENKEPVTSAVALEIMSGLLDQAKVIASAKECTT